MGHIKDRSGLVFGKLTIIKYSGQDQHGQSMWLCACECGETKEISLNKLTQGGVKSCGCLKNPIPIDISYRRFGKLVAIKLTGASVQKGSLWLCKCDCGNEKIAIGTRLRQGEVISCGCANYDHIVYRAEKDRQRGNAASSLRRARKRFADGSFTASQVAELYQKQHMRCANCKTSIKEGFHRDHKIPLVMGGANDISNIELLCQACNLKKSAKDPIDWALENGRLL